MIYLYFVYTMNSYSK